MSRGSIHSVYIFERGFMRLVTGIEKALQNQAIAVLSTFHIYWLVIKFQNFMIINRVLFNTN